MTSYRMRYVIILLVLVSFQVGWSQTSVGFSIGGTMGQLRFKDTAEGKSRTHLSGVPGLTATAFYFLDLGPRYRLMSNAYNTLGVEVGYKSHNFIDRANSLVTMWNLQYATGQLLYRYTAKSDGDVRPFLGGGLAVDYLYAGTQSTGFSQFNLVDDLLPLSYSLVAEAGISYTVSGEAYATLRLGYLRGLSNVEKDEGQQAMIDSFRLSVTLFFNLDKSSRF